MAARVRRAAIGLGLGAAASTLFAIPERAPWRLVAFGGGGVIVTLVLAALAIGGGVLARRALVVAAGLGFAAAAVVQLVQLVLGAGAVLGQDGSTMALFLAFAVGLAAVGTAQYPTSEAAAADASADRRSGGAAGPAPT